jgi:hypothetical protein
MGNKKLKKLEGQSQKSNHLLLELVAELERFKKLAGGLGNGTQLPQQIKSAGELRKSADALAGKAKALERSFEKQEKIAGELPAQPVKKSVKTLAKGLKPKAKG